MNLRSRKLRPALLAAAISALWLPAAALADEADLVRRIDALTRELEQLKKQVQAAPKPAAAPAPAADAQRLQRLEERTLGRWLTVGGEYEFRIDSLKGTSKPFTDVNALFGAAQSQLQAAFFSNPTPATGGMLAGFAGFAQGMEGVGTVAEAQAFLGANAAMMGGLSSFAAGATVPAYKPKNDSLYSHRFALDLNAKATQNVSVNVRLLMQKSFGSQDLSALSGSGAPFFADRVGVFDGTLGHVPSGSQLDVDRAYATWSGLGGQDIWFSVGRRPATDGAPLNLKANGARPGNGGTPALLVNYAFDGMTLGWAPEIDSLPGFYGKVCYGRGFDSGFSAPAGNSLKDTDMLGIAVIPYETDRLRIWTQWNRGMHIFDAPAMRNTYFGDTRARTNLGDIDWFGLGAMGTVKKAGPGDLHWFIDVGTSTTRPNQNVSAQFGFQGLMTGAFFAPEAAAKKHGSAIYLGLRYDLPSRTKLGLEFNQGSRNWITFAPAAGDMWTSKLGTRGHVVDAYVIQEFDAKPVSSVGAKSFLRLGVQAYTFKYTGSNNWVGAPVPIGDVNGQMMAMTPLSRAVDAYVTLDVKF